jgi:TolA-binding protein
VPTENGGKFWQGLAAGIGVLTATVGVLVLYLLTTVFTHDDATLLEHSLQNSLEVIHLMDKHLGREQAQMEQKLDNMRGLVKHQSNQLVQIIERQDALKSRLMAVERRLHSGGGGP